MNTIPHADISKLDSQGVGSAPDYERTSDDPSPSKPVSVLTSDHESKTKCLPSQEYSKNRQLSRTRRSVDRRICRYIHTLAAFPKARAVKLPIMESLTVQSSKQTVGIQPKRILERLLLVDTIALDQQRHVLKGSVLPDLFVRNHSSPETITMVDNSIAVSRKTNTPIKRSSQASTVLMKEIRQNNPTKIRILSNIQLVSSQASTVLTKEIPQNNPKEIRILSNIQLVSSQTSTVLMKKIPESNPKKNTYPFKYPTCPTIFLTGVSKHYHNYFPISCTLL